MKWDHFTANIFNLPARAGAWASLWKAVHVGIAILGELKGSCSLRSVCSCAYCFLLAGSRQLSESFFGSVSALFTGLYHIFIS